jgi:hypothetical protein
MPVTAGEPYGLQRFAGEASSVESFDGSIIVLPITEDFSHMPYCEAIPIKSISSPGT